MESFKTLFTGFICAGCFFVVAASVAPAQSQQGDVAALKQQLYATGLQKCAQPKEGGALSGAGLEQCMDNYGIKTRFDLGHGVQRGDAFEIPDLEYTMRKFYGNAMGEPAAVQTEQIGRPMRGDNVMQDYRQQGRSANAPQGEKAAGDTPGAGAKGGEEPASASKQEATGNSDRRRTPQLFVPRNSGGDDSGRGGKPLYLNR